MSNEPRKPSPQVTETRVEELAAEYVTGIEPGDPSRPDLEPFLDRLESDDERSRFRELVKGAEQVESVLPTQLGPGSMIAGRYHVLRSIGAGGMGRVFGALDTHMEREVAIKVLPALDVGDQTREDLLLKESRLLASIDHPNIVSVHEVGRDGELMYVVMDLVNGEALSDVIENARQALEKEGRDYPRTGDLLREAIGRETPEGRPDLVEPRSWYRSVAAVASELARTLEAAHAKNVIHRDLKPGNILLLGGGSPIVLDFGLAGNANKPAGEVTSNLYGSAAYLAPEQAKAFRVGADPRSDVYQLGLVLYELLTLRRAFAGDSIGPVLENIRRGIFDRPRKINPNVPDELEAICLMAMELDPEKRYQTAQALREDLDRYLEGLEAPVAARFSLTRRLSMSTRYLTRRHPRAAVVVGIAVLLLVTFKAWDFIDFDSPDIWAWRMGPGQDVPNEEFSPTVQVGDSVGVYVNGGDDSVVYAMSVFGPAGGDISRKFFMPLKMVPLVSLAEDASVEEGKDWGADVESGKRGLWCMSIEVPEGRLLADGAPIPYEEEELWVVACADRQPILEQWLGAVDDLFDVLHPLVTVEEALTLLTKLKLGTRGGRLGDLSPERREELFGHLDATRIAGREGWTLPQSTRREFSWQVERPGE